MVVTFGTTTLEGEPPFGRTAAPAAAKSAVATEDRPQQQAPALRVKGIEDDARPPLTYSGPSEDGNAAVQRQNGGGRHAAPAGATRRERREAARKQARGPKPPDSVRRG